MLLLTLLPLAGWADVPVTVGDYSVNLDKQYIAVGNTVPTVKGVTKGGNSVSFSQISVVKSDKVTEVASITLPGIYYKVVKANKSADTYDKLLVPFYAGEEIDYEFIASEAEFTASKAEGKALNLYYAYCIDQAEANGTYCGGTVAAWTQERDNWSWAASKDFPTYSSNKDRFPMIGITAPLSNAGFRPGFIYTGELGTNTNSDDFVGNAGKNKLFDTPWGTGDTGVFGTGDGQRKYGIASTNSLYGTGQVNAEGVYTTDLPESTFDKTKFTAIWVPADLNLTSEGENALDLAPVTFSKIKIMARVFHVPFGTDVTGNDVTPDMFTILSVGEGICSEVELAASGLLKFVYLDGENTKVSIYGHPFKIEYNGEPFEYTTTSGAENVTTTYEIVVVTDQNTMYFDATPNSFMEGQIPTVVSGDLTYNAEAQNLISSTGKTMFVHADETASNVKYLVVTKDKVTLDTGEATQPVEPAPEPQPGTDEPQPGTDEPQPGTDTPEKFKLNYEPAASEWTDDATATDVAYAGEGNERAVDYYYVFAKASAGIGEAEGWTEGKTVEYIGKVKINKATPVLEMAGIDPQYYLKSRSTATQGLHKALTPEVTVKVASGKVDTEEKPIYNTLTAGKEYKAEDISVVVCTKPSFNPQYYLKDFKCSTVGEYRITSAIAANDNLNELGIGPSYGFVDFTVVRPKVIVDVTVNDVPFATEPNPTIGTQDWTTEGYHDGEILVANNPESPLVWKLQTIGAQPQDVNRDGDGNYPAGTYTVVATGGYKVFTSDATGAPESDHEIVYKPTTINIGMADIVAQVPNQNLIYGQALPMNLQHVDGLTGAAAQSEFNNTTNWKFVATLVDATSHKPILDENDKEQTTNIPLVGGNLPAGTYKVTCSGQTFHMPNAQNQFKVVAGAGYWTVTPKKLDNSDFRQNVVGRIQGYWANNNRPYVTYNGEPQLPNLNLRYAGTELRADQPAVPAVYWTQEEIDAAQEGEEAYGKTTADVKIPAIPEDIRDFSVEVISAGGNIHAANNIRIRLTGHGNYQGTYTLAFDIRRKEIQVLPVEAEWKCGSDEVVEGESIYDIDWVDLFGKLVPADKKNNAFLVETATKTEGEGADAKEVTYIKTNNLKTVVGFKDLAVRRLTGPNVGTFNNGIEAYLPENAARAQDYNFTPGTGKIVITKGFIALKVNPNMKAEYAGKGAYPLTTGELVLDEANSTLGQFYVEDDNWKQLVDGIQTTGELGWTYSQLSETVTRFNVGDEYRISIGTDAANSMSSTNYDIVITPDEKNGTTASALVEITKAPITLTSKNQGPYDFEKLADVFLTTTNQITATTLKGEDELSDLVNFDEEELTGAVSYDPATVTTGVNEEAIDINTKVNGNYTVTKVKGNLTVNLAANLILYSNMETEYEVVEGVNQVKGELGDQDKIIKYNGLPTKSVTLYLKAPKLTTQKDGVDTENENFKVWKANDWHAMVLPFAIKARDLSNQLGYAVINVVDPAKTEKDNVRFTLINLSKEIPANTPFCVKTDEDFNFTNALQFGSEQAPVTIVQPEAWKVTEDAGMGYTFVGTYEEAFVIDNTQDYLRFLGPNKWYYVSKAGTKYTMQPYNAYVDLSTSSEARNVTFTFEEEDGSTTAIKAVDFMNGKSANAEGVYRVDGVKMNTVPTQKGVYIQNGKKYVK